MKIQLCLDVLLITLSLHQSVFDRRPRHDRRARDLAKKSMRPTPKPFVGSASKQARAVAQAIAASAPCKRRISLGWSTGGKTAARTMAARTDFGVGASNLAIWGKAKTI